MPGTIRIPAKADSACCRYNYQVDFERILAMSDLLVTVGMILFFSSPIAVIVYRDQRRKATRRQADRIIDGSLKADVTYINLLIDILRPEHFYTRPTEEDLFLVKQLRKIRDKQLDD